MAFGLFETGVVVSGGKGIGLNTQTAFFTNRTGTALAIGDIVQLDLALSATESTNHIVGDAASGYSNVVGVTTLGATAYPLLAAAEAIADNQSGKFTIRGVIQTTVEKASGNVSVGDKLVATNGDTKLSGDLVVGAKVCGIALTQVTAPGTGGASGTVLFDGISGFVTHAA